MTDILVIALLGLLREEQEVSTARAAKHLGIGQSALLRLLAVLSDDPHLSGMGLVEQSQDGKRTLLRLSERGRAAMQDA